MEEPKRKKFVDSPIQSGQNVTQERLLNQGWKRAGNTISGKSAKIQTWEKEEGEGKKKTKRTLTWFTDPGHCVIK